jgi:hypothetical protein
MQNLTQLELPKGTELRTHYGLHWKAAKLGDSIRTWITGIAKDFFSKDELDKALLNRRSESTDEAVIADFHTFERPIHIIPEDTHLQRAVRYISDQFNPGMELHPIAFPDLRYYPWNLKPNVEAPWNLKNFKFTPTFRDLDGESENPKLQEYTEKLASWMSSKLINIEVYLKAKTRYGFIQKATAQFHNLYNEIFHYNRTLVHHIKDGHFAFWTRTGIPIPYYWNTLHARAHVVSYGEPSKIRAVFGATKLLLMVENMFIWNLQRCYLNNESGRMLWGREMMKGGWKRLFNEIPNGSTYLSVDWSKFDKRMSFQLIDIVHKIWRSYFNFDRYQPTSFYPEAKTNPQRIERLWKWMCYSIKHTPILLPNQELWKWNYSGFGSGYQQTQLMDSFANAIMITTCLSALGINIEHESFWIRVQGDDSLTRFYEQMYVIYGPNFLTKLSECALYYFDAKLSTTKSSIGKRLNNISVLSYMCKFGFPYRTDEDLLTHLLFPEKEYTYPRLMAATVGLAMAACGCSTKFHNLCSTIYHRLESEGWNPAYGNLYWMVKTGLIESTDVFEGQPFPTRMELMCNNWISTPRTEAQKQHLWTTKPGIKGKFYFI